jgi:hypothetical protein
VNIRDAITGLTFDVDLDDDEMVTDAIVLARVTRMSDGRATFTLAGSDGLDTVVRTGLIECARQIGWGGWEEVEDD